MILKSLSSCTNVLTCSLILTSLLEECVGVESYNHQLHQGHWSSRAGNNPTVPLAPSTVRMTYVGIRFDKTSARCSQSRTSPTTRNENLSEFNDNNGRWWRRGISAVWPHGQTRRQSHRSLTERVDAVDQSVTQIIWRYGAIIRPGIKRPGWSSLRLVAHCRKWGLSK